MPDVLTINSGMDTVALTRFIMRGINGKVTGAISLGTIPANKGTFVPMHAYVGVQAPQSITTVPQLSIGTNSPNFDDLVAISALTNAANLKGFAATLKNPFPLLVAGTNVQLNITTAGVSAGAITLTLLILGVWS